MDDPIDLDAVTPEHLKFLDPDPDAVAWDFDAHHSVYYKRGGPNDPNPAKTRRGSMSTNWGLESDADLLAEAKAKRDKIGYADAKKLPKAQYDELRERGLIEATPAREAYERYTSGEWSFDEWYSNARIAGTSERRGIAVSPKDRARAEGRS